MNSNNSQLPTYPVGHKSVPGGNRVNGTGAGGSGVSGGGVGVNVGVSVNGGQQVNRGQQVNGVNNGAVNSNSNLTPQQQQQIQQAQKAQQAHQQRQGQVAQQGQQQQGRQLTPQQQQMYLQQQQQRLQQSGMTPEQIERYKKLTPEQKRMLMIQQYRKKAKTQVYYESNEELLKKFENVPASLEFHIHENHYRFGNQDSVIPKNSSIVKQFLEYVAKGEIPEAFVEVIKDGGIRLYDGNLILKVLDHRFMANENNNAPVSSPVGPVPMIKTEDDKNTTGTTPLTTSTTAPGATTVSATATATATATTTTTAAATSTATGTTTPTTVPGTATGKADEVKKNQPKEYRTILRSTQLSQYDDLSYQSDSQQFLDHFAVTFEGEILTSTNRNINLQPVLNPFLLDKSLRPELEINKPHYDEVEDKMVFQYRVDSRGEDINIDNVKYRKLHEDLPHHDSKYEQIMNILSAKYNNNSNINDQVNETESGGQFQRLRIIEMWRRKFENLNKQASLNNSINQHSSFDFTNAASGGIMMNNNSNNNNGNANSNVNLSPNGTSSSNLLGMTQQQRALINKERMMNQRQKEQMAAAVAAQFPNSRSESNNNDSGANGVGGAGGGTGAGSGNNSMASSPTDSKKTARKPRKPTKKQLAAAQAAQAAQAGSTPQQHQGVAGKTIPGHANVSGKTLPGQAGSSGDEPPKKKRASYKKKKPEA